MTDGMVKGKVFLHWLPSDGPEADPGVQAVSPQVTFKSSPVIGCQYFLPGLRLCLVSVYDSIHLRHR